MHRSPRGYPGPLCVDCGQTPYHDLPHWYTVCLVHFPVDLVVVRVYNHYVEGVGGGFFIFRVGRFCSGGASNGGGTSSCAHGGYHSNGPSSPRGEYGGSGCGAGSVTSGCVGSDGSSNGGVVLVPRDSQV